MSTSCDQFVQWIAVVYLYNKYLSCMHNTSRKSIGCNNNILLNECRLSHTRLPTTQPQNSAHEGPPRTILKLQRVALSTRVGMKVYDQRAAYGASYACWLYASVSTRNLFVAAVVENVITPLLPGMQTWCLYVTFLLRAWSVDYQRIIKRVTQMPLLSSRQI